MSCGACEKTDSARERRSCRLKIDSAAIAGTLILSIISFTPAISDEQDLNSWSGFDYNHRINEKWGAAIQVEARFKDDISKFDESVLKPGAFYYFNDWLYIGLGYKYQYKNEQSNENDIWQEIDLKQTASAFDLKHRIRMEQRFIDNISGTIHGSRYLFSASYPLNANMYLAASEAVLFNLNDKGTGPVSGFEQNRLYSGIGFKLSKEVRLEFGYLWRYERKRSSPNSSDHVLRFQLLVNTDGRK